MFWFWDPTMIIVLPAILLALFAQLRVQSTYARYSQVPVGNGLTGAAPAAEILRRNGLSIETARGAGAPAGSSSIVQIERINGVLSDHYDPPTRTLSLSSDVYDAASVAAVAVVAPAIELAHLPDRE